MFVTPLCLDNLLHCSRFDKEDKIYATEVALKTQKKSGQIASVVDFLTHNVGQK